jgi:hypothetical protein
VVVEEEERIEYDEHGKPVIKFVKAAGTRKKKKKDDGRKGVKNTGVTLGVSMKVFLSRRYEVLLWLYFGYIKALLRRC